MKVLSDLDVSGKRVFLRADLDVLENVGAATNGEREASHETDLENSMRLLSIKPTVDWLLEHGAKQVIIAGHLDRPGGKVDPALSTQQLVVPLEKILKRSVVFKEDLEISEPESMGSMSQLVLLENLRFWPEEEANDEEFAKELANLADVYVGDAFGTSHRAHASIVGVPALLEHAAGLNLRKEVETLSDVLQNPEHPFVVIIGGAKLETKVPVIGNLANIADFILVGGKLPLEIASQKEKFDQNVIVANLTQDTKDIDDEAIKIFKEKIAEAKVVFWNGNLGLCEQGFERGTEEIARAILESRAKSTVGGGDTTTFLSLKNISGFSHVSSGGGAMLEFLAGKELPGIVALA